MKNCPIDLFNRNSASQLNLVIKFEEEGVERKSLEETLKVMKRSKKTSNSE